MAPRVQDPGTGSCVCGFQGSPTQSQRSDYRTLYISQRVEKQGDQSSHFALVKCPPK